ncbi:hypothetical protein [Colwellia sp. KU-HH00111]|uniref:COG3014 family protein n=1 Tax=Colwellia sp. KU-HH00111 TaxID=3127652 RepID=UPI0033658881
MINSFIKIGICIITLLSLSGCSSASFNDLFSHYNQQMLGVKQAQQQGDFQTAIKLIPSRSHNNASYGLSLLEKARLAYLANNHEQSQKYFAQAYSLIQQAQQAAKIELSRSVENVAAVLSNDNATRYDIPLYEQSMLNSYQALNYLAQQNLSGALVEIRRANLVQQQALKDHAHLIYRSEENMTKQGITMNGLTNQYPAMNEAIGQLKNGFQNAYTFYLSALIYDAVGQYNDAYIDYKKALEIYPNNYYLQQDIWRLANSLQMTDDISQFKKSFRRDVTLVDNFTLKNQGQVVIIVENGIVPAKQELSLNLPIYTSHNEMRYYSIAVPSYQNYLEAYTPVMLNYQGKRYQSEEIVRISSLAAKQLKDQLPRLITRQIVRLIAKEKIRKQMELKGGDIGNIFANIYNMATEKADTRSWSTLPDSIHILKVNLDAGQHELGLNINGIHQGVNVTINTNKTTLVRLTAIGSYVDHQSLNL